MSATPSAAWLETADGRTLPLAVAFCIGRNETCDLILDDHMVSRRHAMIQQQFEDGSPSYWLVDFGSRNGTYLDNRRITHPTRLQNGAVIKLGSVKLRFREGGDAARPPRARDAEPMEDKTMFDVRPSRTWLLVTDVIGSTRLLAESKAEDVPVIMGEWLMACREIIQNHQGRINQFMGDGFFAHWPDTPGMENTVLEALKELRGLQTSAETSNTPNFRFVLHLGAVTLGGVAIGEEERISGPEVHYAFRMEKLAGKLTLTTLFSSAAHERLQTLLELRPAGEHPVPGFDGEHAFYTLA